MKETAQEQDLGQVTSKKDRKGTTDFLSKRVRDVKTRVVRRFWDELRRHLLYGGSGIRHKGGLSLAEAIVGNMGSSESM